MTLIFENWFVAGTLTWTLRCRSRGTKAFKNAGNAGPSDKETCINSRVANPIPSSLNHTPRLCSFNPNTRKLIVGCLAPL